MLPECLQPPRDLTDLATGARCHGGMPAATQQAAHLGAGAGDHAARQVARVDLVLAEDGLLAQRVHAGLGHVREDHILLHGQPDGPVAVPARSRRPIR